MRIDLLIIGSGLTGLFAANLAIDQGLTVLNVSRGRGGLSFSHGCIDIYDSTRPARSIKSLPKSHPYQSISMESLKAALKLFKSITREGGIEYSGGSSSSIPLLSAAGMPYRTSLVPEMMIKGRLDDRSPITIAGLEHFRDFWAKSITSRAKQHGIKIRSALTLPMLQSERKRDFYATDIASQLANDAFREELWRAWKPKLTNEERVGLPAILGLQNAGDLLSEAESYFGVSIFEIPTLPPTLPGLRLEGLLKDRFLSKGGRIIEGPSARGRIDGRSKGKLAAGIQLDTAGGLRTIDSRAILLATGGFLHGGLLASHHGSVSESVFGIPIHAALPRDQWSSDHFWETQRYAYLGLIIDDLMRPLDLRGKPFLENVFAAGGLLSGADRTFEGSRQGIDLATAYQAIQCLASWLD